MSDSILSAPPASSPSSTVSDSASTANGGMTWYGPRSGWQLVDLTEVWRYRDLVWMLALRDIKVKYRQTAVGVLWAVIQPVLTVAVFGVLFSLMKGHTSSGDVPYAVTSMCGIVPWQLFASTLRLSTQSLVSSKDIITKVYFPRVILPLAVLLGGLIDFAIAFSVLLLTMICFGVMPTLSVLWTPVLVTLTLLTTLAFSLWLSALNAIYRDVEYVVPFALQIAFFVSPVVYEMNTVVPQEWQWLYSLNPLAGVLEGFRWALLGLPMPSPSSLITSIVCSSAALLSGLVYFRRMERHFADRI